MYKIVRNTGCGLFSYSQTLERATTEYKIGEWVRGKIPNTNVFCFDSIKNARAFKDKYAAWSLDRVQLYLCKVRGIIRNPVMYQTGDEYWNSWVEAKFNGEKPECEPIVGKIEIPGTVAVRAIKLIKRLKWEG